jgi:hypothetical protein
VSYQYVWLLWSVAFLFAFLLVYAFSPRQRSTMLLAGVATAPFGLTEPLFVPEYWSPPSLFDLAQKTGFDIESLVFTFSIGGVAVVMYNRVTGRSAASMAASAQSWRHHRLHGLALLTPGLVFVLLAAFPWNPIYPAVLAMIAGAAAAISCRPDLLAKTLVGGLLFASYYAIFMIGLVLSAPGYIQQFWNLPDLSGIVLGGIPLEELLFGFAFGVFWSGVYEHLTWTEVAAAP